MGNFTAKLEDQEGGPNKHLLSIASAVVWLVDFDIKQQLFSTVAPLLCWRNKLPLNNTRNAYMLWRLITPRNKCSWGSMQRYAKLIIVLNFFINLICSSNQSPIPSTRCKWLLMQRHCLSILDLLDNQNQTASQI